MTFIIRDAAAQDLPDIVRLNDVIQRQHHATAYPDDFLDPTDDQDVSDLFEKVARRCVPRGDSGDDGRRDHCLPLVSDSTAPSESVYAADKPALCAPHLGDTRIPAAGRRKTALLGKKLD